MICAQLKLEENTLSLRLHGHAETGAPGFDPVCAAASVLAYTGAQIVKDLGSSGGLLKKPVIRLSPGDARIDAVPKKEMRNALLCAFSVLQVGFTLLARNFPDCVRLDTSTEKPE